jgi:hypothetical protein
LSRIQTTIKRTFLQCVCNSLIHIFPTHRWTGHDITLDQIGLGCCINEVFVGALSHFLTMYLPIVPSVPSSGCGEDLAASGDQVSLAIADGVVTVVPHLSVYMCIWCYQCASNANCLVNTLATMHVRSINKGAWLANTVVLHVVLAPIVLKTGWRCFRPTYRLTIWDCRF